MDTVACKVCKELCVCGRAGVCKRIFLCGSLLFSASYKYFLMFAAASCIPSCILSCIPSPGPLLQIQTRRMDFNKTFTAADLSCAWLYAAPPTTRVRKTLCSVGILMKLNPISYYIYSFEAEGLVMPSIICNTVPMITHNTFHPL